MNRTKAVAEDVRDFVARQLAHELAKGSAAIAAMSSVRGALPENQRWAITEIENLFGSTNVPRRWHLASRLMAAARERGASAELAFAAYQRNAELLRPSLSAALTAAATFGAYFTALFGILTIVVAVYAIHVLPQFVTMFDLMGAKVPAFTLAIVGDTWILLPVLALLVLSGIAYWRSLRRLRERLLSLEPMRPAVGKVPGFRAWAASHDTELWLRYLAIFLDTGLSEHHARAAASAVAGEPVDAQHRLEFLASAAALGRMREELHTQVEIGRERALERFERLRNSAVNVVRAFVYAIVAAYILAMYLPIFKLGAVV